MKMIVCIDDNGGMMFNHRRQSQDGVLRKRILSETQKSKLWMNPYSYKQFKDEDTDNIIVDEGFMLKADKDDYCFIENISVASYEDQIKSIIIYKWNRRYPSDLKFDISLKDWKLMSTEDFKGSSHEKITKEVYFNEKE
ncbi:MAG: ribonuclease Z [Lachnospiraceae bacterium]